MMTMMMVQTVLLLLLASGSRHRYVKDRSDVMFVLYSICSVSRTHSYTHSLTWLSSFWQTTIRFQQVEKGLHVG